MENIVRFVVTFIIVMIALIIIPRVVEFIIEKIAIVIMIYKGGRLIQGCEKDFNFNSNQIVSKYTRECYKFSIVYIIDVCSNYIINHIMKKIFKQIEQDKSSFNHYLDMPAEKDFNNLLRMCADKFCQFCCDERGCHPCVKCAILDKLLNIIRSTEHDRILYRRNDRDNSLHK